MVDDRWRKNERRSFHIPNNRTLKRLARWRRLLHFSNLRNLRHLWLTSFLRIDSPLWIGNLAHAPVHPLRSPLPSVFSTRYCQQEQNLTQVFVFFPAKWLADGRSEGRIWRNSRSRLECGAVEPAEEVIHG